MLRWQTRHEFGERRPDLIGRILLQKMPAPDRDLSLVRPGSAEFAGAARHDHPGLADNQQFGERALRQPFPVALDDRRDVGRLPLDRNLTWLDQCRQAGFSLAKRRTVRLQFLIAQFAQDIRRQDRFHEEILVEDHVLALVGA